MKIAQITRYFYPIVGGQQNYVKSLLDIMHNHKIKSTVFQPHITSSQTTENVFFTKPILLTYRALNFFTNYEWFLFNLELRFVKNELSKYDILLLHYSFHYNSVKNHPKVIILSHGILWSNKLNTYFDKKLKDNDFSILKNKNVWLVANDTNYLRTIGIDVKAQTQYFKEIRPKIWFIPNAINTQYFKPDNTVKKNNIVLIPRNIREDRGIDLAIRSFKIFSEKHPDYELHIAGGPLFGKYFEYCKHLVLSLNLTQKVVFKGFVSAEEIKECYLKSKMCIIPTIEKEGTSLSALESMACGTPVVATNIGGLLDLPCLHCETDQFDLAQKMEILIADYEYYVSYQKSSVCEIFNMENWQEAWIKVLTTVSNTPASK
jgi:glycosyltransferase involved in cell wall biosynthesis